MLRRAEVLLLLVTGLVASTPAGAARLVAFSTARAVSEGMIPQGVTDVFLPDVSAIHAVAVFSDASAETKVRGVWISEDAIETPNYEIDSAEVALPAAEGRAHFQLSKPNQGWPTGRYRLDLYVDGVFVTSASFRIDEAGGRPSLASPAPLTRPATPPSTSPAHPGKTLIGTWLCQVFVGGAAVGEGEVSFSPAGWVQVGDQRYSYQTVAGDVVRLQDGSGYSDYGYTLQGGGLRMWADDGSEFRCGSAGGEIPGAAGDGSPPRAGQPSVGRRAASSGGEGEAWRLRGTYCHWAGSSSSYSSYGRTERITFDGQGRWTFGSESSFSSGAGLAYGGGDGDSGTYRVSGHQVFYRTVSGEQGVARVNMQQDDGRITEIMVNGELYAPQLCE